MTDLVERLRQSAEFTRAVSIGGTNLDEEAAAEIERLRADAARWHWLRFNGVCVPQWEEGGFAIYRGGVTLDAAIDAAMKDTP